MMLPALLIGISGVGIALCLLLLRQVRAVSRVASLKPYRSKAPALADRINYAAVVDDGVIVCKNGALMAAWEYAGTDNASSTDDQRAFVSRRLNEALRPLGS